MQTAWKITQIRLPADLYEAVRELAHEERQSRNQFMVEGINDRVAKLENKVLA